MPCTAICNRLACKKALLVTLLLGPLFGRVGFKQMMMSQQNNFVNPDYNEGAPHSSGTIMSSYVVEESDTLPDIARKFNLTVEELLTANKDHIADATGLIQTGTRIMIPKIKD